LWSDRALAPDALTVTFALPSAIDWLMSREPDWYFTLFPRHHLRADNPRSLRCLSPASLLPWHGSQDDPPPFLPVIEWPVIFHQLGNLLRPSSCFGTYVSYGQLPHHLEL